jgi:hypothetical protein
VRWVDEISLLAASALGVCFAWRSQNKRSISNLSNTPQQSTKGAAAGAVMGPLSTQAGALLGGAAGAAAGAAVGEVGRVIMQEQAERMVATDEMRALQERYERGLDMDRIGEGDGWVELPQVTVARGRDEGGMRGGEREAEAAGMKTAAADETGRPEAGCGGEGGDGLRGYGDLIRAVEEAHADDVVGPQDASAQEQKRCGRMAEEEF